MGRRLDRWHAITNDKEILETVSGLRIPTTDFPENLHKNYPECNKGMQFIDQEINALLIKGVITECDHECEEFISPIFVTEKSDGGFRLILNLKKLNESIEKIKFKMQTLTSILCLIRPLQLLCGF